MKFISFHFWVGSLKWLQIMDSGSDNFWFIVNELAGQSSGSNRKKKINIKQLKTKNMVILNENIADTFEEVKRSVFIYLIY